ncbi:hypothetical protein [Comamonas koreensis]|uniref:hypothetical protein n=1 Tax=Comamonas koreensis TaxID=160825 RepID=UPI0015FA6CCB|nr:hypothetical protein [Comamonas koreensis]
MSEKPDTKAIEIVRAMGDAAQAVFIKAYPQPSVEGLEVLKKFTAYTLFDMCAAMGSEAGAAYADELATVITANKEALDEKRKAACDKQH